MPRTEPQERERIDTQARLKRSGRGRPRRAGGPRRRRHARVDVAALGLLVTGWLGAAPSSLAAQGDPLEGFDGYVAQAVVDWEVPGLAVAVVKDGELLFARGYGVLEAGQPERVDEHTLFSIGSTTKAMTAAVLAMLVDEGRIAWDDPVIEHLPWFQLADPYLTRHTRVRDLLTHNVGLPNADYLWYEQDRTPEDIVRSLRYVEATYPARGGFIYQNIMYAAAGQLTEAVTGRSWGEVVEARIFEPLGMTRSVTSLAATRSRDNVAVPHFRIDGTVEVIRNASVDPVAAAGSVWSSVHDMSLWARFLLAGGVTPSGRRLISEATFAELFRPHAMVDDASFYPTARLTKPRWKTYGLGWFQADYEGRPVDFHTGSIDGMVAIHGLLRREGIGVYVLGNLDHAEVRHAIMYRVFDRFDPDPPRDWSAELHALYGELAEAGRAALERRDASRVENTRPSLDVASYAGTYAHRLYGRIEVTLAEGSTDADAGPLQITYGRLRGPLGHWHYDMFRYAWETRWRGDGLVRFELGPDGTPSGIVFQGREFPRVRSPNGGGR